MKNEKAKSLRPIRSVVPTDKPTAFQRAQAKEKANLREVDHSDFAIEQHTNIRTIVNSNRQHNISWCPGSREFAEQQKQKEK